MKSIEVQTVFLYGADVSQGHDTQKMTRQLMADVIQTSTGITYAAAMRASQAVVEALVAELLTEGKFVLPGVGTLRIRDTNARKALNPRTGEAVNVKAGATVRFKVSQTLRNQAIAQRAKAARSRRKAA